MRQVLSYGFIALLLTTICGVECYAAKAPKTPPDPKLMAIKLISVLPIVDSRAGEKASVNLEKVQEFVMSALKRKRFNTSAETTMGPVGQVVEEDLQGAKPDFVKKLGPAESRWVMAICLGDVTSKLTYGSTGNAELTGYLFDKESGELIWKAKGAGQAGQGGLLGMAMKGAMKTAALQAAGYNLVVSLPTLPKPGK